VQDNEAYDFVVEMDGEFFRFQAKTAYESKNEGTFRFETRSTRVKNQGYEREGYDGKIDYFAVYHPETDGIYVVPIHEVPENQMAIRYEEAPPGYESGVNWYEDYLLDHFV